MGFLSRFPGHNHLVGVGTGRARVQGGCGIIWGDRPVKQQAQSRHFLILRSEIAMYKSVRGHYP